MKFKILDLDKETINNRIYPTKVVKEAINNPIIQEYLQCGGIPIELKNIDTYNITDSIDMSKIIGFGKKIYIEDDALYVEAESIINNGKCLGNVSFIGTGNIELQDNKYIVTEFHLEKLIANFLRDDKEIKEKIK